MNLTHTEIQVYVILSNIVHSFHKIGVKNQINIIK